MRTDSSLFFRKLPRELRDKVYSLLCADGREYLPVSDDFYFCQVWCTPFGLDLQVNKQFWRVCREQSERDLRLQINIRHVRHHHCVFLDDPDDLPEQCKKVSAFSRIRHVDVLFEADPKEVTRGKLAENASHLNNESSELTIDQSISISWKS